MHKYSFGFNDLNAITHPKTQRPKRIILNICICQHNPYRYIKIDLSILGFQVGESSTGWDTACFCLYWGNGGKLRHVGQDWVIEFWSKWCEFSILQALQYLGQACYPKKGKQWAAKLRKIIRKGHTHLDWICDVSWMNAYKCLQAAIRQLGAGFMKKTWTSTILRDELLNKSMGIEAQCQPWVLNLKVENCVRTSMVASQTIELNMQRLWYILSYKTHQESVRSMVSPSKDVPFCRLDLVKL